MLLQRSHSDINASDIDSDNTAHGYHADNPNFLSKTIVATLFIGAFSSYSGLTRISCILLSIRNVAFCRVTNLHKSLDRHHVCLNHPSN